MNNTEETQEGGYCPTCGSCGETGCCPPTKCHEVKCYFGEHNILDYGEVCTKSWASTKLLEHLGTLFHCKSLIGKDIDQRELLALNVCISRLFSLYKRFENCKTLDDYKTVNTEIELYIEEFSKKV